MCGFVWNSVYSRTIGVPLYYLGVHPPKGGATCSRFQGPRILDIVPPEGGLRQFVALTQYVVRGTRTEAQDIVAPRRGVRHYATLTQDIVPRDMVG